MDLSPEEEQRVLRGFAAPEDEPLFVHQAVYQEPCSAFPIKFLATNNPSCLKGE